MIIPVLFGKLCCVSIATPVKCTAPPIPHPQGGTYCPPPASIPRECVHCTASSPQCQPESQRPPSLEVTAFLGHLMERLSPMGREAPECPIRLARLCWGYFLARVFLCLVLLLHFHRCWSLINIFCPDLHFSNCSQRTIWIIKK